MNLMIVSPGRRVEIVEAFKDELHKHNRKVYTVDMSKYAPALYVADEYFLVEKDFNNLQPYVENIIKICKEKNIGWILTLIDPELKLFKEYENMFDEASIKLIISDMDFIDNTLDKYKFFTEYKNILSLVKTFISIDDLKTFYGNDIPFPIFVKDRFGSASIDMHVLKNRDELEAFDDKGNKYIFQEMIDNKELGVDVYFDFYSNEIVDIFMKKKLSMRAGETDKSISIWDKNVEEIISKLKNIKGIKGAIDVDIFIDKKSGKAYINEINPRFGGGYFHAHSCGCDYIKLVVNNMLGNKNAVSNYPHYTTNITMLKYNNFLFKEDI